MQRFLSKCVGKTPCMLNTWHIPSSMSIFNRNIIVRQINTRSVFLNSEEIDEKKELARAKRREYYEKNRETILEKARARRRKQNLIEGMDVKQKFGIQDLLDWMKVRHLFDIEVYDISTQCLHQDFWIVASTRSPRATKVLSSELYFYARSMTQDTKRRKCIELTPSDDGDWAIVDIGHVWVHIFTEHDRRIHNIEEQYENYRIDPRDHKKVKEYDPSETRIVDKKVPWKADLDDEGEPLYTEKDTPRWNK